LPSPTEAQSKIISLTQGKVAIVDEHNYAYLSQFKWRARKARGHWYAMRHIRLPNGKRTVQLMHRAIMGVTDPKIQIDHKDRNATLDNRESNLRIATSSQNACNRGAQTNSKSGIKGVYQDAEKSIRQWHAGIQHNGKQIGLGWFDTAIEAARAYNEAALKYHGAFAYQNDLSQAGAA
jgi:hypothetical protein